jgi:hypothetical protein
MKAKRDQTTSGTGDFGPYLASLPTFDEYETLHNWSTPDEVQPFLKGTTLGSLVTLDRTTRGIQTRYRDSVEPYLQQVGAIDGTSNTSATATVDQEANETSPDYRAFLEASMCISTRGFHLLPTTDAATETKAENNTATKGTIHTNRYDGPFLLPVIDLLNHDPKQLCTTLRRHEAAGNASCYFAMVAERDIAAGEEIFHSYGSDMTSAQLLQTFGFVPRNHSSDALARAGGENVWLSVTPVGLSTRDHLLTASRSLKSSSFPDTVMDRIRTTLKGTTEGDEDEDDCFWEVCEIPDRPNMVSEEEFLVSASHENSNKKESMLTDSMVTLMVAQFLPIDALEEIFPPGEDVSNTVLLDRSILEEDYYLGMLVCKSLLVALFLKGRDYSSDTGENTSVGEESTDFVAKAISGAAPPGVVGRYLSSLLKTETARVMALLDQKSAQAETISSMRAEREMYGRTIRTEELTNLISFCRELEALVASLSLGGSEPPTTDHELPPHKRAKTE